MTAAEIARLKERAENGWSIGAEGLLDILTALEELQVNSARYQRDRAELSDRLNGTPCAEIRWQHEGDALRARLAVAEKLAETLRFIADENNSDVPTKRTAVGHLQSVADAALREWDALRK